MNRKLLAGFSAALLSLSAASLPAAAAPRTVPVTVDGALLSGVSYLENGVTSVPLRTLLDTAGGWNIYWDSDGRQAVAETEGRLTVTAKPGETVLTINGEDTAAPSAVYILNGRTYVPVRALGEALGWSVEWDSALGGAAVSTVASPGGEAPDGTPDSSVGTVPGEGAPEDSGASYSEEDLYWLSRIISAESQGEPLEGQIAVGNVVMNRVASDEFPNTIQEVIFDQKYTVQFEPVSNGTIYHEPTALSVAAAKAVLNGAASVVGDCLYFYAPALSQGLWINANRTYYKTIGCHRFYL